VEVVAEDGRKSDVDSKAGNQEFQSLDNPLAAVIVVFSARLTHQEM
jgi:hypothetical protein